MITDTHIPSTIERWLSDGDTWIGVFENHDLGSQRVGERCAFPFSASDGSFDTATLGKTRAPDGKTIGLGWRYILVAKTRDTKEAIDALIHNLKKGQQ